MTGVKVDRIDIDIDPALVRALVTDPDGPVIRDLDRRMTRAQLAARGFVRVRTGRLLSSIRKNRGATARGVYVDVVAGHEKLTPYLGYEHDGTRPHVIRARHRKALRFVQNGQVRFAKQVRHPGTTGSRFLERALPFAGD